MQTPTESLEHARRAVKSGAGYIVEDFRPSTFLERGITAPFTTPFLLGSRVRPAARGAVEIVVPNPAGVRGSYVVPISALSEICVPTLHDRLLCKAIEERPNIAPATMLALARSVTKEGLAGEAAASAAITGEQLDRDQRILTNFRLLIHLVEQAEPRHENSIPPGRDTPANVEQRARRAIARTAPELGISVADMVVALEQLAAVFAPIGFRGDPTRARYQRQLEDLQALTLETMAWLSNATSAQDAGAASLVVRSAEMTVELGQQLLSGLLDCSADIRGMVCRWTRDQDAFLELAARPAWLLDGWATLIGIWRTAGKNIAVAVREMAMLVPTMPKEVNVWTGCDDRLFDITTRARSRFVFRLEEWRSGGIVEIVARNEALVSRMI
ncbi:hypothetical protein JMJ56_22245 [Belnapia sp. T18]|uniref:Uncharacterized protein n=1 Tax=Belnapia arida TaxID=2804533 RepID=A0ABS1UBY4_9PROT|nr:hypothetical protein [Belnapia arida]MBL6080741.1 hypothetical protein [Belnapia arida]